MTQQKLAIIVSTLEYIDLCWGAFVSLHSSRKQLTLLFGTAFFKLIHIMWWWPNWWHFAQDRYLWQEGNEVSEAATILLSVYPQITICMIITVHFIYYKFVKGFLVITFFITVLVISSWNFHDVCQRFLYNQKQNFNLIQQKTKTFPIDPHYKNRPPL